MVIWYMRWRECVHVTMLTYCSTNGDGCCWWQIRGTCVSSHPTCSQRTFSPCTFGSHPPSSLPFRTCSVASPPARCRPQQPTHCTPIRRIVCSHVQQRGTSLMTSLEQLSKKEMMKIGHVNAEGGTVRWGGGGWWWHVGTGGCS